MDPEAIASLKKAGFKKILRMTLYSTRGLESRVLNSKTILIDNCGNVHELCHRGAARNVRANQNSEPVKTMNGDFVPKKLCSVPFIGDAIFSEAEKYSVLSQALLMENQNIWVESKGDFEMDIHFIPLNYILPARWTNYILPARQMAVSYSVSWKQQVMTDRTSQCRRGTNTSDSSLTLSSPAQ